MLKLLRSKFITISSKNRVTDLKHLKTLRIPLQTPHQLDNHRKVVIREALLQVSPTSKMWMESMNQTTSHLMAKNISCHLRNLEVEVLEMSIL